MKKKFEIIRQPELRVEMFYGFSYLRRANTFFINIGSLFFEKLNLFIYITMIYILPLDSKFKYFR